MKAKDEPFRIEKKASFKVIGYELRTTNQKKQGSKQIQSFWSELKANHKDHVLMSLSNPESQGLFGISIYNVDDKDSRVFDYRIAVVAETTGDNTLTVYEVPANTWAVFSCTQETIGKTEAMAITKWLPKSGYKPLNKGYLTGRMRSGAPDIEFYGKDNLAEVWIAVCEK